MSPTELVFWLVFVSGAIGALFNPTYGVVLYVLIYSLNPETQWWGYHINLLGLRTSFTVAVVTAIGMVLNWRSMRGSQTQIPLSFIGMGIFLLYAFTASTSGLQPLGSDRSQFILMKLFKVLIFIFMMIRVVRTAKHFKWLVWSWMAGTIYIGYQAWSGVGVKLSGRLTGGLGGPDFSASGGLAAHLVMMIALAGFMFYTSKSIRGRVCALLAAGFAVNTIILTRTRNAFPGFVVLIVFGMMRLPRGLRLKCLAGIVCGLGAAFYLTDAGWWDRMRTMQEVDTDTTITSRFDYWNAAMEMARNHPFGVGVSNFRTNVQNYLTDLRTGRSAHSTYFECLAELGYPGLIIFLGVLATTFWQFGRARAVGNRWYSMEQSNPELAGELRDFLLMATANEVAMAGFLACSVFHTRLWTEGMWLLLATSGCLFNISREFEARCESAGESQVKMHEVPLLAGMVRV
jgi:O-antigen ligase